MVKIPRLLWTSLNFSTTQLRHRVKFLLGSNETRLLIRINQLSIFAVSENEDNLANAGVFESGIGIRFDHSGCLLHSSWDVCSSISQFARFDCFAESIVVHGVVEHLADLGCKGKVGQLARFFTHRSIELVSHHLHILHLHAPVTKAAQKLPHSLKAYTDIKLTAFTHKRGGGFQ